MVRVAKERSCMYVSSQKTLNFVFTIYRLRIKKKVGVGGGGGGGGWEVIQEKLRFEGCHGLKFEANN